MPTKYVFKEPKSSDNVAKALLFVAKFSRKQATVRFSDSSVCIVCGGTTKGFLIQAGVASYDMFVNRQDLVKKADVIVQVDPSILGKTLRGCAQDRHVTIVFNRIERRIRVKVEHEDTSKRVMLHIINCEFKSNEDYKSMLITEIERTQCHYHIKTSVDNVHRLKHQIEALVRLNAEVVNICSKQTETYTDLTVYAKTPSSNVCVNFTDLPSLTVEEETFTEHDEELRRAGAVVTIETKKLASYLAGLIGQRKATLQCSIEHRKSVKISQDYEISAGEQFHQSILLLHHFK